MKSDQEIMNSIRAAIDDCTRGIDNAPSLQYQIARKAKGEEPVVKKISTTVILVAALLAITVVALAAGSLIFGWVDFYKDGHHDSWACYIHRPREIYRSLDSPDIYCGYA